MPIWENIRTRLYHDWNPNALLAVCVRCMSMGFVVDWPWLLLLSFLCVALDTVFLLLSAILYHQENIDVLFYFFFGPYVRRCLSVLCAVCQCSTVTHTDTIKLSEETIYSCFSIWFNSYFLSHYFVFGMFTVHRVRYTNNNNEKRTPNSIRDGRDRCVNANCYCNIYFILRFPFFFLNNSSSRGLIHLWYYGIYITALFDDFMVLMLLLFTICFFFGFNSIRTPEKTTISMNVV